MANLEIHDGDNLSLAINDTIVWEETLSVSHPFLVGADTNGPRNHQAVENIIGPLAANRVFYPAGLPSSYGTAGIPLGVRGFISYKAGSANTVPFVSSCPPGTRIIYHHEPENDYGADGTKFVQEWQTQKAIVKKANPSVLFGMVGMAYQYDGRNGNGTYIPNGADFYGVDVYTPKPTGAGLAIHTGFQKWRNLVKDSGVPLSVTEYGVGVHPPGTDNWSTQRALSFHTDNVYLRALGGFDSILYWYNSGNAGNWTFKDPASITAWKAFAD